jgi:predicted O-methyltransferase YrrM
MANCNHGKCRNKPICGHIAGTDRKNPGGNIYTPGQLHKHKGHQLRGWHSAEESKLYNKFISGLKNGIIVEVGVFGGASLLGVISSCQKTNSHIYGIDPWEKIEIANGVPMPKDKKEIYRDSIKDIRLNLEKIIKAENYSNNVTLIRDFSRNAVKKFKNKSVDIVFIDGDHAYNSVYEDLGLWLPKVKPGGIVWGDDFCWGSVKMAVKDFCRNNKITFQQVCGNRAWKIRK